MISYFKPILINTVLPWSFYYELLWSFMSRTGVFVVRSRFLSNCVTHSTEIYCTVFWSNTGDLKCSVGLWFPINMKAIIVLLGIECCRVKVPKKFEGFPLCCLLVPVKIIIAAVRVSAADVHRVSQMLYHVRRLINGWTKRTVFRGKNTLMSSNGKFINYLPHLYIQYKHSSLRRVQKLPVNQNST